MNNDKKINEILFAKKQYLFRKSSFSLNSTYTATILKSLESVGYTLSNEALELLNTYSEKEAVEFHSDILGLIREKLGSNKKWSPMYPNFPTQVMETAEAELYLNAMMHYLGDWIGVRIMPKSDKDIRLPLIDKSSLKVIKVGTADDIKLMITNLMKSKTSLSKKDTEILEWGMETFDKFDIPKITFKETFALVFSTLLKSNKVTLSEASENFKTATDVLRLAVVMSEGDISLASNTRFVNFKRKDRRFILSLLENMAKRGSNIVEDMLKYKKRWIKLGERLHPFEYKLLTETQAAFYKLRNNVKVETFNSKLEAALEARDISRTLVLLSSRPGVFARKIDHVLRVSDDFEIVLKSFKEVASEISTNVLLQVLTHFSYRNDGKKVRVFIPKGNLAKIYAIENNIEDLPEDVCNSIVDICKEALILNYHSKKSLGRVYIDPILKDYTIPLSQRSASEGLRIVSRGSKMAIPEGNTLRFFCWWKDLGSESVDIDLSAIMYNEKWEKLEHISYTNLKSEDYLACHSGDITSAPRGACEFIDLDIKSALKDGVRFAVMSVYSFSGQSFSNIPELFCGWMSRTHQLSGEIFEARTVEDKFDLTGEIKASMPLIFDLKERKVIYADLSMSVNGNRANNLEGNLTTTGVMCQAIQGLRQTNLHTLFSLHTEARGELVDSADEADTVFSLTSGITPFDIDVISGEFI